MSGLALLALAACSKNDAPATTEEDVEQLYQDIDRTQEFVRTQNQDGQAPFDFADYQLVPDGVAPLETSNDFFGFVIDRDQAYHYNQGEGWDAPVRYIEGEQDPSYNILEMPRESGSVSLFAKELMLGRSNGEEEKGQIGFEAEFGSVYTNVYHPHRTDERGACQHGSPTPYSSPEARESFSFYEALETLTTPDSIPQNSTLDPDHLPWTLVHRPFDRESGLSEVYSVNMMGPSWSAANAGEGENPYKGEWGTYAGLSLFSGSSELTALLSPDFIESDPDVCVNLFESDGVLENNNPEEDRFTLGTTYFIQAEIPLGGILETLEDRGNAPEFDLILTNTLDNPQTVRVGYCQGNEALTDATGINIPSLAFENNGRLLDLSAELCYLDVTDTAFLTWVKYGVEKH